LTAMAASAPTAARCAATQVELIMSNRWFR
jgi:hypothetical protein